MNYDQKYFLFYIIYGERKVFKCINGISHLRRKKLWQTNKPAKQPTNMRGWGPIGKLDFQQYYKSCSRSVENQVELRASSNLLLISTSLQLSDPLLLKLAARATLNLTSTFATLTISNGKELAVEIQGDLEKLTNAAVSDSYQENEVSCRDKCDRPAREKRSNWFLPNSTRSNADSLTSEQL